MKRKTGFYWVRFQDSNNWRVAEYSAKFDRWEFSGMDIHFRESSLSEINENKIISPDEKENNPSQQVHRPMFTENDVRFIRQFNNNFES